MKNAKVGALPQKAIKEYRDLYKKHYGVKLSYIKAALWANDFLELFRVLSCVPKGSNKKNS